MATPITVDSAGGEYMESVVVLEWTAALGDAVTEGDVIVTVETAKAATEIEAPCSGVLTAIMAEPGSEILLSSILGLIGKDAEDIAFEGAPEPVAVPSEPVSAQQMSPRQDRTEEPAGPAEIATRNSQSGRTIASPAARREADKRGLDLSGVAPSSPTGRIKLRDLETPEALPASASLALPANEPGPLNMVRSGAKSGTPVVMFHGFAADAASWYPLESQLSRKHPVIRIELPNHGKSPKRRVPNFAALAKEIAHAFDDLHLEQAHLVGHSLGGACALALADIRPRKIASLCLIAPGGLGPKINEAFIEGMARASRPASLAPWLQLMVADPALIGADFVGAAMSARRDPRLRAAQQQMARDLFPDGTTSFDLTAAVDRLVCPTRIIWGRADAVLSWRDALKAPGRTGLHLFENTGHVPQLEQTEAVLEILSGLYRAGV